MGEPGSREEAEVRTMETGDLSISSGGGGCCAGRVGETRRSRAAAPTATAAAIPAGMAACCGVPLVSPTAPATGRAARASNSRGSRQRRATGKTGSKHRGRSTQQAATRSRTSRARPGREKKALARAMREAGGCCVDGCGGVLAAVAGDVLRGVRLKTVRCPRGGLERECGGSGGGEAHS